MVVLIAIVLASMRVTQNKQSKVVLEEAGSTMFI